MAKEVFVNTNRVTVLRNGKQEEPILFVVRYTPGPNDNIRIKPVFLDQVEIVSEE